MSSRLIVSFTCLPSRVQNIPIVLKSISEQTLPPDIIVLHVPDTCIRLNQSYDVSLIKSMIRKSPLRDKIILNRCDDYGPITKLYPLMRMRRIKVDDMIIVIDDDHFYNPHLFSKLVFNFRHHAQKSCVCVSGLRYPTELNANYMCIRNGYKAELMEAAFGYICHRSFFGPDFKKWVLHSLNKTSEIHDQHWDNAFVSDDYVVSRYLDTRNISKVVIIKNPFVHKDTCFVSHPDCTCEDSLSSIGHNLDKYVKAEIELKLKKLV